MIKVNVLIDEKSWKNFIRHPEFYLKSKIKKINKYDYFNKKKLEFSVLLSANKEIKKLNKKFRKKNKITDVLSFPFYEKNILNKLLRKKNSIYLGDIIINLNKVLSKPKLDFSEEKFNKLWIHGFLHLLGFKHKINTDYSKMKKLENKFFKLIN
jgi:probable rRNA maturation factor|tara:strand:- start:59 stop:520 length:462 start_codon:yes stop_codon:yes gene_type:complete